MPVILGILALALMLWLVKSYVKADPALLKRYGRRLGGYAAFAAAALLVFRGRIDGALLLAGLGGWLLGIRIPILPWYQGAPAPHTRTAWLDLQFGSRGEIDGRVINGPFAGRDFSDLSETDRITLLDRLSSQDPEGYELFKTYLDRNFPRWRETAQGHAHTRERRAGATTPMTEQEAYDVLGLKMGAGEEEIREAHRALLRKIHPDHGGTDWLATRINMARDVLLKRHG